LEWALGQPFTLGNRIDVLRNGDEIFPAMLEAIEAARRSVAFVTFVYWTGEIAERFADALSDAARRGVKVRVVIDALGGLPMDARLPEGMEAAGVHVQWFRPISSLRFWRNSHRTHRKVLIVDHEVGFTGGVGIAEEWTGDARGPGEWRDTHFRVRGPAVMGLWAAFAGNWMEHRGELPDPEDNPPCAAEEGSARIMPVRATSSLGWSDVGTLFDAALALPRRRLWIATAYFVPDDTTAERLGGLAEAGVDVRVLVPSAEQSDKQIVDFANQRIIRRLLERGVRLYRFTPTMLHTKLILVDEALAVVGSANLNHRSVKKDDEIALAVLDEETARVLSSQYREDLERAFEVTVGRIRRRPWWYHLLAKFSFRLRAEM
jgi:cardiolipin synthase